MVGSYCFKVYFISRIWYKEGMIRESCEEKTPLEYSKEVIKKDLTDRRNFADIAERLVVFTKDLEVVRQAKEEIWYYFDLEGISVKFYQDEDLCLALAFYQDFEKDYPFLERSYNKDGYNLHTEKWWSDGLLHREGEPAYEMFYKNGNICVREYRFNGQLHRLGGPARQFFQKDGKLTKREYWIEGAQFYEEEFQKLFNG